MVLKRPVSWHRLAIIVQFQPFGGTMGKTGLISVLMVMLLAGANVPRLAFGSPATPAIIAEVLAALDKGDAQQAAILSDDALRDDGVSASERARLLLYRGLARELLGQHDAAMRDFTLALDTDALPPDERGQALLQRGFLDDGLGRLNEAVGNYTAAIAMKGYSTATALNNRANIYRRQNKLQDARRDYLAALSADGGQPQYSYYGLGQIAETEEDISAARGFYAKALIVDPDYADASERLAALGGPLDGTIAVPGERIVLHPPPAQTASGASQTSPDDTIVLRGPDKKDDVPFVLHPVASTIASKAKRVASTRFTPVNEFFLRPALDQSDVRTSGTGRAEVQLGAWRSAAEAHAGWDMAKARAEGALDGLRPRVLIVDLPGKGRYFRLRAVPGAGQSGTDVCARLAVKAVACLPVRD
jgi:tetratricopeptide (TPR) repeat protein